MSYQIGDVFKLDTPYYYTYNGKYAICLDFRDHEYRCYILVKKEIIHIEYRDTINSCAVLVRNYFK